MVCMYHQCSREHVGVFLENVGVPYIGSMRGKCMVNIWSIWDLFNDCDATAMAIKFNSSSPSESFFCVAQ